MKKIIITILMIATTFLGGCGKSEQVKQDEQKNKEQVTIENQNTSFVYLIKLDEQAPVNQSQQFNEIANLNCVDNLIKVNLNKKVSPKEALEILFEYKDYNKEKLYNVFDGIDNIKIKELILKNNFAILKLNEIAKFSKEQDIENVQIATCAAQQIKKTLEQFDTIAGADIYVGEDVLN